jgi:hypothetical protein
VRPHLTQLAAKRFDTIRHNPQCRRIPYTCKCYLLTRSNPFCAAADVGRDHQRPFAQRLP